MFVEDERETAEGLLPVTAVDWLIGKAANVNSQGGEDGLLATIFDRIGTTNKWCFEVGASDGVTFSNCRSLVVNGWNAVFIENDGEAFAVLQANYAANTRVRCLHEYVEPWTIDALLATAGYPFDGDLGVIDIDEQDFWVWAGMRYVHPRVMVVEYAFTRPSHQVPPLRMEGGAPIAATQAGKHMIYYLGMTKGYTCVAITKTNILFVDNGVLDAIE